jgi:hypothetical protein
MKRKVPSKIAEKYKVPSKLTDFQLSLYIHLIEWKWENITKNPGMHGGREYDAILPKEFAEKGYPLYQPIVKEMGNHSFKKHKYFGHMASSQAACINLFAPILKNSKIANTILPVINSRFRSLAIDYLESGFQFEYWDESNPLNDHTTVAGTDSDIAIAYYDIEGNLSLWLIEHKLTEDEFTTCGGYRSKGNKQKANCRNSKLILSDESHCYYKYHCDYKYWQITNKSKLFNNTKLNQRKKCPFIGGENQLWRNQLMGYAIQEKEVFKNVHFSVIHHHENTDLQTSMDNYRDILNEQSVFDSFTSKDIIESAKEINNQDIQEWLKWYSVLYRV